MNDRIKAFSAGGWAWVVVAAIASTTALVFPAQAQNAVSVAFMQGKAPVAPDAITTLGPEMFGDKINLYNGSFAFEHTDAALPGNSALPVALVRQHTPGRSQVVRGALGDWDLNTPRIEGTFARPEGWVPQGGSASTRCSGFDAPPQLARGAWSPADFPPWEYWQGTNLVIPGQGSQEILVRAAGNNFRPTDGGSWPLLTHKQWQIGCLGSLQNAPGQGFIALSPEGVRYKFDWMASRPQTMLRKGDAALSRSDFYLMATLVTDRFGNWVRYTYNSADPLKLQRIESNDGRVITLGYANGRVATVSDGTRTWLYHYSPQGDLQTVQQPDGSAWQFNLRPLVNAYEPYSDDYTDCDSMAPALGAPGTGTITHPSGAVGSFDTQYLVHGRTNVDRACTYISGSDWTNGAMWARSFSNQALVKKQISGPVMHTMTWLYGGDSNSPYGEWAPCNGCQDRKFVTVTEPNGSVTRHTFGIKWRVNEGQLLALDEGWNGSTALKTTVFNYRVGPAKFVLPILVFQPPLNGVRAVRPGSGPVRLMQPIAAVLGHP